MLKSSETVKIMAFLDQYAKQCEKLVICGPPKSCKSEIAQLALNKNGAAVHLKSDDYLQLAQGERAKMLDNLSRNYINIVASGMTWPRVLRRQAKAKNNVFTAVIVTYVDEATMKRNYVDKPLSLRGAKAQGAGIITILAQWEAFLTKGDNILRLDINASY